MPVQGRILVSGAGVAGLTAALGLARAGYQVTVVERAPSIRAGGFLVSLSHTAYQTANQLGLIEPLQAFNLGITRSSYHDASGRQLLGLDYARLMADLDIIQVMRDDLVQVLFDQVRQLAEVRFGDHITTVNTTSPCAAVTLASGTELQADLAIIAEGQNSPTRGQVFGEDATSLDYLDLCCAAVRVPNVAAITGKFETHMERNRYMACFNTRGTDLGAVFVWSSPAREKQPRDLRATVLRAAFDNTSDPLTRALLETLPDPENIYMDTLFQVTLPTWTRGMFVAIGDAANCLTLFSGRGAAAAVTSAHLLTRAICDAGLHNGIHQFEADNRKRIHQIQAATRRAVKLYVPGTWFRQQLRDNAMRWLPERVFQHYFQRKYRAI
ncbi:MAG: FAD-dependent monooxygenase [Pseudomonadota bacterium]